MAATRWDASRLQGIRDGTDTEYLAILNRSVRGCAVVGARALGKSVGHSIFEEVCQELWIFLLSKLDTLRPDAPLEPYLIAAAKLIAMSTARKLFPLAEKSIDEDSDGESGESWVRSKMEFEAGYNPGEADGGVGLATETEGHAEWGLDAALGFPGEAATQGGDDTAENLNGATDHLRATPTSVADVEARIDREKALQLLTNKSPQLRQLQLYNRLA